MVFVFFAAILAGLIFQRSRLITLILLVLCAILFSFNTENPDYEGYLRTYESIRTGGEFFGYFQRYDLFYKQFVYLGNALGLSFNLFRLAVFFFCAVMILSGVRKITTRVNLVLALYMIFPFVMDCVQIRNFIAEAVVIHAIPYLLQADDPETRKNSFIKYTLCVFAAALFHYVSIVYLLFVIVFFRKWYKYMYIGGITLCTLMTIVLRLRRGGAGGNSYISSTVSPVTFVYLAGISVGLIILLHNRVRKKETYSLIYYDVTGSIFRILTTCTILVPILVFQYDMFRFLRNMYLAFSAFAGLYINRVNYDRKIGEIRLPAVGVTVLFTLAYGLLLWRSAYYPYDLSLVDQIIQSIRITV